MNAERLNSICLYLKREIDTINIRDKLSQLLQNLEQMINQPQTQPQSQQQISNILSDLLTRLSKADSNKFSPAWRQSIEEIGGHNLLGEALSLRIKEIFERNQITLVSALKDIREIQREFDNFKNGIDNTVQGLNLLKIRAEELEPGECEIGFTIPRNAVSNNINEFGKELQQINFILETLSEIASGKKDTFEIKSISSSDLSVYLTAIPSFAACLLFAAEKIIDIYKKFLEAREIKARLKALGWKEKELKEITDRTNSQMGDGIKQLSVNIINSYFTGKDELRKNELQNKLTISLNRIANRIDQGFNIEVRAEPLKESAEAEETEEKKQEREFIKEIIDGSEKLEFLKLEGDRILGLIEKESEVENE